MTVPLVPTEDHALTTMLIPLSVCVETDFSDVFVSKVSVVPKALRYIHTTREQ